MVEVNELVQLPDCRVCGSDSVQFVDSIRPYRNYSAAVFDCMQCGCRFVEHDPLAHEKLHSTASSYAFHKVLAKHVATYFGHGQIEKLRQYLRRVPKYKFVIDSLDMHRELNKIAEIGCSLGYLAAYFIASGREIYGFDISQTAILEASKNFGEHFYLASPEFLMANSPYDAIYHVGTIGCVESPLRMTNYLLSLLKPGGLLIFNAPNRRYLEQTGDLWVDTPPPDLVTIFPTVFWERNISSEIADVTVRENKLSLWAWLQLRHAKHRTIFSDNERLFDVVSEQQAKSVRRSDLIRRRLYRLASGVLKGGLEQIGSPVVDPYGFFVLARKKDSKSGIVNAI